MTETNNNKKTDYDMRCDAIQVVSNAIADLPRADIDRMVEYAELLKSVRSKQAEKSAMVEKESLIDMDSILCNSLDQLGYLKTALNSILGFFLHSVENESEKLEILNDFNQNRKMLYIALDYAEKVESCGESMHELLNNIFKESGM